MLASFAELLASSEIFRFDGADMMPGAVGSGTFWTEATAWIVGGSTEDMLDNIEGQLARLRPSHEVTPATSELRGVGADGSDPSRVLRLRRALG